jgi:hypothetical protein
MLVMVRPNDPKVAISLISTGITALCVVVMRDPTPGETGEDGDHQCRLANSDVSIAVDNVG